MTAPRHTALRLFLSLWIIFCVHWATDFVREHFLVVSIVDRHSFALDGFEDLHPDIFLHSDGHAYHGANPGISMLGAVPYFVLSPVVDWVVARELSRRGASDDTAVYNDPRPARRAFFRQARAQGLDVRFGLVGLITMVFAMAPLSALGGVVFYRMLRGAAVRRGVALGATALYAFGTPIFLRTGYLNQNLAVGIAGLVAFALLWHPGHWSGLSVRARWLTAGAASGFALLCDYSGGLLLPLLGLYGVARLRDDHDWRTTATVSGWFVLGTVGPVLLLWYYQWAAFGAPFYPPQHHMAPVEWSDLGYQGVAGPRLDLAWMLLIDPRFGLFVNVPVALLALAAPWVARKHDSFLPLRETLFTLLVVASFVVFFSMVHYTRLQYITGIRYLVPAIPFLVLPALVVLLRIPRWISYAAVVVSIWLNWGLAMGRFQEQEQSVLDTLQRVYLQGLQLPALTTLSKMSAAYLAATDVRVSALPVFLFTAIVLVGIWTIRRPWSPVAWSDDPRGPDRGTASGEGPGPHPTL